MSLSKDAARSRQWRAANLDRARAKNRDWYHANRERARENAKRFRESPEGRASALLSGARRRAKTSGVAVTITREELATRLSTGRCEVTGLPFDMAALHGGKNRPFTPSLDQKVPGEGYTPENTQVVLWAYNAAKGDWGHDTLVTIAKALCG